MHLARLYLAQRAVARPFENIRRAALTLLSEAQAASRHLTKRYSTTQPAERGFLHPSQPSAAPSPSPSSRSRIQDSPWFPAQDLVESAHLCHTAAQCSYAPISPL